METVRKEIQNAWRLLSTLPVSGDAVDVLAGCRMALRRAYAACAETPEEREQTAKAGAEQAIRRDVGAAEHNGGAPGGREQGSPEM